MTKYDVVWYWNNSRSNAGWIGATFGGPLDSCKTAEELTASIRRAGRVAHPGLRAVGPPDDSPSEDEFRAALGL
jgi:hypothetical protein